MISAEVIRDIVDTIVREVQPEQVFLFGSAARGDANENSDVDLLVVEKDAFEPHRSRLDETNRIYRAISQFRVPTDVLLYSVDEFDHWSSSINHVVARCRREGKLLYARH